MNCVENQLQQPDKTLLWFLRTTNLFQGENTSFFNQLIHTTNQHHWPKGSELPILEDEKPLIHMIISGSVRVIVEEKAILELLSPGDVLGGMETPVAKSPHAIADSSIDSTKYAIAMSDCTTLQFTAEQFSTYLRNSPTVLVNFVSHLEKSRRRLELRLSNLLFRSSLGKVAGILLELAERFGEKTGTEGHVELSIALTHQDISSLVGLRRESVSLALATLELEEYIQYKRNQMTILRVDALSEIR